MLACRRLLAAQLGVAPTGAARHLSFTQAPPTLMTLEAAERMAKKTLEEARRLNLNPVAVAVVDLAGDIVVQKREDNVGGRLIGPNAVAKAISCTHLHASTRALKDKYAESRPTQLASMSAIGQHASGMPLAPFPGGVLLRETPGGSVVGAIGVSGASADEDEHCALAGARAVGFTTEPEESAIDLDRYWPEAWYMAEGVAAGEDQKKENRLVPNRPASVEELEALGTSIVPGPPPPPPPPPPPHAYSSANHLSPRHQLLERPARCLAAPLPTDLGAMGPSGGKGPKVGRDQRGARLFVRRHHHSAPGPPS